MLKPIPNFADLSLSPVAWSLAPSDAMSLVSRRAPRRPGMGCSVQCGGKGFNGVGLGLFDSLDPTTWGLTEWIIVGGAVFLVMKGTKLLSSRGGDRKKLARLRAEYDLKRASL